MADARRWLAVAAMVLVATACGQGTYPVDVFPEMHYQPSRRRLEPQRIPPPADAVPVTGSRPRLTFAEAGAQPNPVPDDAANLARGREVYRVNCAACHGPSGQGDGLMAAYFQAAGVVPPVDFRSDRVRSRTDGQLEWIVANGLGGMPPFGDLVAEDDLWRLVRVIREDAGR